jgi:hypothetical protein
MHRFSFCLFLALPCASTSPAEVHDTSARRFASPNAATVAVDRVVGVQHARLDRYVETGEPDATTGENSQ